MKSYAPPSPRRKQHARARSRLFVAAGAVVLALTFYAARVPQDPPGFYIDESSIAYNAHLISSTGHDEHDQSLPLYFRAFGDYKNPVFIYMLAALFRLTGPSLVAARLLSASLGALAALLLGLLAARMTRNLKPGARSREVGIIVGCSALLTPWLYESSRLAFEAAAYPLATVLFLLALRRASAKERWSRADVLLVASTLALLTYSYSIGRLLAPMLAAGLAFFVTRRNLARVVETWTAYALTLLPLLVFNRHNPGALGGRFALITYATPQSSLAEDARQFALHYLEDINPWRWLVTGEWNVRDHASGSGALLVATVLLAACGLFVVLREDVREAWWRFLLYALAASVVPAALTVNDFPQLRLVAFPVFLHVLTIPALARLTVGTDDNTPGETSEETSGETSEGTCEERRKERHGARPLFRHRAALYAFVALLFLQGAYFQWLFHRSAAERWYVFDARFAERILAPALATNRRPIYLYDPPGRSGYVQALWHAALRGIDSSRFFRLAPEDAPPPGALVISTEDDCSNCRLLARSINYILYAVPPTDLKAPAAPLPPQALRAEITSHELPASLAAGEKRSLNVVVRNLGGATWPAVGDEEGRYAVRLRGRWLRNDGTPLAHEDGVDEEGTVKEIVDEDGAARIPFDIEPGDAAGLRINLKAPSTPGDYVLELDMAQEGSTWFGARGSKTLRMAVRVFDSTR